MPKHLTQEQIDRYHERGYCAPIDVMPEDQALALGDRLREAEEKYPDALNAENRNNPHIAFKFMDEIVFNETILDIVEDLIGPNILTWGSVLFIKEPETKAYVSWHQDATYMGIEPHEFVTPWLALSHSNEESGCMSVIPGSHHAPIQTHEDTFGEDNILTRGQVVSNVDESQAVNLILRPGQASCHHARLVHGSRPNRSNHRRIGAALQAYMTPDFRQAYGESYAMLARGKDSKNFHTLMSRPTSDMALESVAMRETVNQSWAKILYRDAEKARKY